MPKVNGTIDVPRSTIVLNPMCYVECYFQQKYRKLFRDTEGAVTVMEDYPTAPALKFLFNIPLDIIAQPESCILYVSNLLSRVIVDQVFCQHFSQLLAFYTDFATKQLGFLGFHVVANVEIINEELVDEQVEELLMQMLTLVMEDEDDGISSRGATSSALEKLKNENFYVNGGELVGTCMVCLEEFSGNVELTRMPCTHVFHQHCIFRWLEDWDWCPICRWKVDEILESKAKLS